MKLRSCLRAVVGTVLIFATHLSGACADEPSTAADPTTIGLLVAMTGPIAELGEDCRRGIEIARQHSPVPTPHVRFVYEDSQGDPKVAVNGFNKLVAQDGASAVITMRSPIGMAVNPISLQKRIPILAAVGHPEFATTNRYAFQHWPSTVIEGRALAENTIAEGRRKIAAITTEDEWTLSLSTEFLREVAARGGEVLLNETVLPSDTDHSAIFAKVKLLPVDAVFINMGPAQGATAIKRIRELGFTKQIYSNFWSGDPSQIEAAGVAATNGVKFPEVRLQLPKLEEAARNFQPVKRPSGMTFSCYTATASVLQALQSATGRVNPAALYTKLLELTKVELLDGPLKIENRQGQYNVVMKIIRNGKVSEL